MLKSIFLTTTILAMAIGATNANAQTYGSGIGGTLAPGTGVGKVDALGNKVSGKQDALKPDSAPVVIESTTSGTNTNRATALSTDVTSTGKVGGNKDPYASSVMMDVNPASSSGSVSSRRDGVTKQVPVLDSRAGGALVGRPSGPTVGLENAIGGSSSASGSASDFTQTGVTGVPPAVPEPKPPVSTADSHTNMITFGPVTAPVPAPSGGPSTDGQPMTHSM